MNNLAQFLNAAPLSDGWHFASGTRYDQTEVRINFDNPADMAPTWRLYCRIGPEIAPAAQDV